MEKEVVIEVIEVRYICDKCGIGEMVMDDPYLGINHGFKVEHKCLECGNIQSLNGIYPKIKRETYK